MTGQQARGRDTRQAIVAAATKLFAELGFEHVSIEMVLRDAAISRGALYHHFKSKESLFEVVLEALEEDIARAVRMAAFGAADPGQAIKAGCAAWLRLAAEDRAVRQIVLTDAPAVVGWRKWREIDGRYSLGMIKAALAMAASGPYASDAGITMQAHALLAVLVELAILVAQSGGDTGTMARANTVLEQVLSGFIPIG
jgi:AcrR family transcriptional regulator